MGKKGKSKQFEPNAPEFQHIHHPPQNPYYPDISGSSLNHQHPPPYSELTVPFVPPTTNSVPMSQISRSQQYSMDYPRQAPIIIQQQPQVAIPYNHRHEKYHRRIRSFNNQVMMIAIMAIIFSLVTERLNKERPCLSGATVHKFDKIDITIGKIRDMHKLVMYGSMAVVVLSLLKVCTGRSKGYSCYLFLMGLCTLSMTALTGYLAYLSFYAPCTSEISDLISKSIKSVVAGLSDNVPSPDQGLFGERNIIQYMDKDRPGLIIFAMDVINFVFYLAAFLTGSCLC